MKDVYDAACRAGRVVSWSLVVTLGGCKDELAKPERKVRSEAN